MNNDDFSAEQFEKISKLEQEIARLKTENEFLKKNTLFSPQDQENIFSLQQIIRLMPGNVYWKNRQGIYFGCNNNLAENLSLASPEEIVGKKNRDLMSAELAEHIDKIDEEVMNSTQGKYYEEMGFNKNNEPAIFYTLKLPLRDHSKNVLGILGISLDITERKKIEHELSLAKEKAEASDRAKSQFLAVVNHELRTPLTGIIGLVNLLKDGTLSTSEEKNIIDDLMSCAQYLHTLVNAVLDFTKLEAGKMTLNKHAVILKDIVYDVVNMLSALAKNKGLQLKIEINDLPLLITDSHILRQILINLVSNAIKFTDTGDITIITRCKNKEAKTATIEIAVKDTGQGIPHDKFEQIFEPFQQLEDTYIRQSSKSGTGLGLAIVKRLASLLNSEIHVISQYGKGSTFSLIGKFDILSSNEISILNAKKITNNAVTTFLRQSQRKIKVLMVEDDKIVQHIHKNMLLKLNCDVDIVAFGHEALRVLDKHELAFIDIGLPDMTGFELIKAIRENDIYKELPIIALTGYTGEEERLASISAGANEVAAKPISLSELHEILIRHMKNSTNYD